MRKVLICVHPKWCELIFNGQKTIEVRKTRPLIDMPFKVYVYETKACFVKCVRGACTKYGYGSGKVIGSFVCDKVYKIVPDGEYYSDGYDIDDDRLAETCLTREQLREYGKGVTLYGWHITDLKIYDKPKELGAFRKVCLNGKCSDCIYEECRIIRPPQSWQYV